MTITVRAFSPVGPCIEQGAVVKETARFWLINDRFERGKTRRIGKTWKNHVEPCPSCRDHPQTQYPNGYED